MKRLFLSALTAVMLERNLGGAEENSSVFQKDLQILSMLEFIRNKSFLQSLKCVSLWDKRLYMFCQRYRKCYIEFDSAIALCQMGLDENEKKSIIKEKFS